MLHPVWSIFLPFDGCIVMIVTKIERQQKKERYNVYMDGEYCFAVDGDTLLNFRNLRVGCEVDEDEILAIRTENERRAAYARGFSYLSRAMHTLREVRDKLKKLSYTDEAITYAVDRLQRLNLVNDEVYARTYVETHSEKGKLRLRHELINKGIPSSVADAVIADWVSQDDEIDQASILAEKFWNQTHDKTKVMRRLLSRGYSYSVIDSAISRVMEADCDEF